MSVVHNLMAMNASTNLKIVDDKNSKVRERLGSGFRINRAADDAAGLTISEKMRAQIRGLNKGASNIQDGISLVQVADGALQEVHNMLHRMKELAVQAANDTNTAADRAALQSEMINLSDEIDHVSKDTTFNGMPIFGDAFGKDIEGNVTQLVKCNAADTGYLTDVYSSGGKYHPAAIMDFSGVTKDKIDALNGAGFAFSCSLACYETFDIKFATDGTESSAENLDGRVAHQYIVDISDCNSGADIVAKTYDWVSNNLPTTATGDYNGSVYVSHSNALAKEGDSKLVVFAVDGYSTEAQAANKFKGSKGTSGAIDCASLTSMIYDDVANEFNIQCSSNVDDKQIVKTPRFNAKTLGLNTINISSNIGANAAITKIDNITNVISGYRSDLGAYQNRLEHSFNNVNNTSENTQAAESRIRDANMANEVMENAKLGILSQAGQMVLSQANQSPQGILELLK